MRILLTNDDGWDAPGLAALQCLASQWGEVYVVAPRDPQSYAGHRVTTEGDLHLVETGPRAFHLSGTPADCVRVGITCLVPEIDWVLAGINRGGNLGADVFISGTVAAAREAAFLGKPGIAVSQYLRKDLPLDWDWSQTLAAPVIEGILHGPSASKTYWNVNLPHVETGRAVAAVACDPDTQPLDVRYERSGGVLRYSGVYRTRPQTEGRDIAHCFGGSITVSKLKL